MNFPNFTVNSARLWELERNVGQRKPINLELDSFDCAYFQSYIEEVFRKRCETQYQIKTLFECFKR